MMGWSAGCYIPSFVEIGPPVPEEKIFDRVFTTYGRGDHLGHATSIMSSDFHFLVSENLVQMGQVVYGKIKFEFLYEHNLGPRLRNDLDLQFSHIFIYSIICQLLLPFRSLAATVSEKSTVFTFPYKSLNTKFDLAEK